MQLVLDLMVLLASLIVLPLPLVAVSALGAVVLNVAIALNHCRPLHRLVSVSIFHVRHEIPGVRRMTVGAPG